MARKTSPIWHPFTQHALQPDMVKILRGEGAYLFAADGRRIIDAISSWWVVTHGHCHPPIVRAIQKQAEQLNQIIFAGHTHEPAEQVASAMLKLAPRGLDYVFFSDSGSTSVEVALKMALGYWHNIGEARSRIVVMQHSYHGDTIGAMSVGARGVFNAAYGPLLFDVTAVPFPYLGQEQATLDALEAACRAKPAAFIVEPLILGAGGMLMYPAWVLKEMKRICETSGVWFIADEVMTGWGRTGTLFACAQADVTPDIACYSKGLTGGALPLAVTLCRAEIFDAHFSRDRSRTFFHSSSYTANPIACAAAKANLDLWGDPAVLERVAAVGAMQEEALAPFRADGRFKNVRRTGTITALELDARDSGYLASIGPKLLDFFASRNLLLRPLGNTIYVMPPYCVTRADIDEIYAAIAEAAEFFSGSVEKHLQQRSESPAIAANDEYRLYRKVVYRIIPFIFICYVLNYIDRVNVSFAKLQFQGDLHLSDASYGLGVGLFYVGYILFEVPSNLVLQKIGARKTITRIMCLWGLISMTMAFVSSPLQFYLARILLGAAEAGFFPGVILYLTLWFPDRMRGRIMSFFVLAIAVSGIVGGPTSGLIMQHLDGFLGFRNWQWLFLIEGMLPVVMGITALFVLNDRPRDAKWLSEHEKDLLIANLSLEGRIDGRSGVQAFLHALRKPMLWIATFGYFSVTWAGMVLNFWAPTIIQRAGVTNLLHIGLLSAVPYAVGAAGMLVLCYSSDRRLERRWHFFAAVVLAGCAAIAIAYAAGDSTLSIACLAVLAIGYLTAIALFWTIPTGFLSEAESPGCIAFISSAGQVGSLIAPVLFGYVSERTGNLTLGACLVAVVLFSGGCAVLSLKTSAK